MGKTSRAAVERARAQVADLIGAKPSEIFFSPSATYSNNASILGRARYVEENNLGRHLITTAIEHSSALGPALHLQSRGWRVTILNVDNEGFIDIEELVQAIGPDTSIISVMWANNEIGTLQPVEAIGKIARERGIFFHCDAVQVAGKLSIDVSTLGVDTLSLSGHKFHAPKGIGILYVRNGVEVLPLVFGGGQENGLFPGTEGLSSIVGIGKAAELSKVELGSNQSRLRRSQHILIEKLSNLRGVKITGTRDLSRRLPGHVSVVVEGMIGADIVENADRNGVCVSSVSACSSGDKDVSHVLKAIGLSNQKALGSLRITAGSLTTEEECFRAAKTISEIVAPHQPIVFPQIFAQVS